MKWRQATSQKKFRIIIVKISLISEKEWEKIQERFTKDLEILKH